MKNQVTSRNSNVTSIEATLQERGEQYGRFRDQAGLVQQLKYVMQEHPKYVNLPVDMKEALEMIQHKIGRIINGNPHYPDSWKDIEGYSRCVSRELEVQDEGR